MYRFVSLKGLLLEGMAKSFAFMDKNKRQPAGGRATRRSRGCASLVYRTFSRSGHTTSQDLTSKIVHLQQNFSSPLRKISTSYPSFLEVKDNQQEVTKHTLHLLLMY